VQVALRRERALPIVIRERKRIRANLRKYLKRNRLFMRMMILIKSME
jgi:hypothetical protein